MVFFFTCASVLGGLTAGLGVCAVVGSLINSEPKTNTARVFVLGALALITGFGVAGCGNELYKRMEWEREAAEVAAKEVRDGR